MRKAQFRLLFKVFLGPTTFHQGLQLFEVVGPDVQQLFLAKPLTLPISLNCRVDTLKVRYRAVSRYFQYRRHFTQL